MKSHVIAAFFLSSFASLVVACTMPAASEPDPDDTTVGEASSALTTTRCRSTETCHPDEHPTNYVCNYQCGSATCLPGSPDWNAVICATNTGSTFRQCGLDCPAGYHNNGNFTSSACLSSGGGFNQASCETNNLNTFFTCTQECPVGFVVSSRVYRYECGGSPASGNNAAWCTRIYQ